MLNHSQPVALLRYNEDWELLSWGFWENLVLHVPKLVSLIHWFQNCFCIRATTFSMFVLLVSDFQLKQRQHATNFYFELSRVFLSKNLSLARSERLWFTQKVRGWSKHGGLQKNYLSSIVAYLMTHTSRNDGKDVVSCGFTTFQVKNCSYSADRPTEKQGLSWKRVDLFLVLFRRDKRQTDKIQVSNIWRTLNIWLIFVIRGSDLDCASAPSLPPSRD